MKNKNEEQIYYYEVIVGDKENMEEVTLIFRTEEAAMNKFLLFKDEFNKIYDVIDSQLDSKNAKHICFYIGEDKYRGTFAKHVWLARKKFYEDR